tara:strand:- start:584 stop:739 length:156 start_codon:yes stop_codon:yes gene_type:complete
MGDLERWEIASMAVCGAFCLQILKVIYAPLFWVIFSALLWMSIYRLIKRYG